MPDLKERIVLDRDPEFEAGYGVGRQTNTQLHVRFFSGRRVKDLCNRIAEVLADRIRFYITDDVVQLVHEYDQIFLPVERNDNLGGDGTYPF